MQGMTVNEFLKSLAEAGFTGSFRATNEEYTFCGTINPDCTITKIKVQTVEESRRKINDMLYRSKTNAN